jgi:hypothetical protein
MYLQRISFAGSISQERLEGQSLSPMARRPYDIGSHHATGRIRATAGVIVPNFSFSLWGPLMKWIISWGLTAALVCTFVARTRAEDQDPKAVVDKGIKALGGEEKLGKLRVVTWKVKGKIYFGENENPVATESTVDGLDHYRSKIEGKFGDNDFKGVVVVQGDKGWSKFGEEVMTLDQDRLGNEKRMVYLNVIPATLLPLKSDGFKLVALPDEKVGDKPAAVIKVTPPDKKDFTLYFDKESGLPLKVKAVVVGFDGNEFTMESSYSEFKELGGIKKATKVISTRDGDKFFDQEITEYTPLEKAPAGAFDEPK